MRRLLMLMTPLAMMACSGAERLSRLGDPPEMASVTNPTADPRWRPVSMPMPNPQDPPLANNSLWRPGSRTFLRDQRAATVGDLVTVLVSVADEAELENSTVRGRNNSEGMGIPQMLGLQASYPRLFPAGIDPSRLVEANSTSGVNGNGQIRRNETVMLRVAATVTQVLPNGNLVLMGRQQMRVNSELRDLTIGGVIRPQDIGSDNTIRHDRLAEARISYGGRGTISDVQRPRTGQELLDIILPF
ncbi:flagellar basal body L-ring protein FlgH [Roseomonas terrae]|uniref:Flagellar L-ring protein n=1 Tax=Neoroseomonas terrae TaxID=424799 RepID=A0ABS5EE91_9PROT|nr:flagellar basal body L-ring protein FlgH [Neoroseomonas terrae]MBR0649341.1 flagellar basal body L-ring protein FlgH [Neoroseomonas terrae]